MVAVTATPLGSTLQLVLQTGTGQDGSPVYANRNYRNVKPAASDEDVYAVAQAIAGLQVYPLAEVQRINEFGLELANV